MQASSAYWNKGGVLRETAQEVNEGLEELHELCRKHTHIVFVFEETVWVHIRIANGSESVNLQRPSKEVFAQTEYVEQTVWSWHNLSHLCEALAG